MMRLTRGMMMTTRIRMMGNRMLVRQPRTIMLSSSSTSIHEMCCTRLPPKRVVIPCSIAQFHTSRYILQDPSTTSTTSSNEQIPDIERIATAIHEQKDWASLRSEYSHISDRLRQEEDLWEKDPDEAVRLQRRSSKLESELKEYDEFLDRWTECKELLALAQEENDATLLEETISDMQVLEEDLEKYFLKLLMNDEADENGCYIEIRAGAGGAESCDWTSMLLRMYTQWATSSDYQVKLVDDAKGEIAGLKSAVLQVNGPFAYGWCKHESGVHRLVRVSPFDSNSRRHTSFASVSVTPFYPESSDNSPTAIEFIPSELKIDTFRAQGAGGQHVNKTESAVRITHLPTGIVVACQNERSQHQNKAACFQLLKAKMYERELRAKSEAKSAQHDALPSNAWGNQIRSYTLQPYKLVKDLRTGVEDTNADRVLDGGIDGFLEGSLKYFGKRQNVN